MRKMLKNVVGKVGRSERGFTLIEMLVVIGIIVALAAVIVPTVIKFTSEGESGAKNAEWDAVQASFDVMMADQKIALLTGDAVSKKVTDSLDLIGGQTLSGYLRDASTTYCYTWDTSGKILAQTTC